jgi:hypothetical protein
MRKRSRKLFASVALVAGVALVYFEVRRDLRLGVVDSWFWLVVGALVIVLAAMEFLHGANPSDPGQRR